MLAPLLCAWLGEAYGWHYGFGLAGIGMLIGLWVFRFGIKQAAFAQEGLPPLSMQNSPNPKRQENQVRIFSVLAVPLFALIIVYHHFESYLMTGLLIGLSLYIFKIAIEVSKAERARLFTAIYFTLLATFFWAIFEQTGSSITLFADRNVNLTFLNASQTNSINSAYIILLAIPFTLLWSWLTKVHQNPSTPVKFGVGLIFLGLGFLCFGYSGHWADELAKTPMFYLLLGYFIYTVGEMFISPIGLSKITELSPLKYASFMMGIWFLSSSYGHFFAGKIAKFTSSENATQMWFQEGAFDQLILALTGYSYETAQTLAPSFQQLYAYLSTYATVGLISVSVGIAALLLSPIIKKMMHGVH